MEFHIKESVAIWYEVEADSREEALENLKRKKDCEEIDRDVFDKEIEEVFCGCGGNLTSDEEDIGVCGDCR